MRIIFIMLSGIKSAAVQKDMPRGVTRGIHVRAAERERARGDSAKRDAPASGRSEERSGEGLFRGPEPPARAEQRSRPPARPGGVANKPADLCERSA